MSKKNTPSTRAPRPRQRHTAQILRGVLGEGVSGNFDDLIITKKGVIYFKKKKV